MAQPRTIAFDDRLPASAPPDAIRAVEMLRAAVVAGLSADERLVSISDAEHAPDFVYAMAAEHVVESRSCFLFALDARHILQRIEEARSWPWSRWFARRRARRAIFRAQRVYFPSHLECERAQRVFDVPPSRAAVLDLPVARCYAPAAADSSLPEGLRLPEKFYAVSAEDESSAAGLSTIFDAYAGVDASTVLPLVVLASPEWRADAAPESTVIVRGADEALRAAILARAHALLFPARDDEGFALPALMAAACGTPSILPAFPWLHSRFDGAAKFVHPLDVHEWRQAIRSLSVSIGWREEAGAVARKLAERSRFDAVAARLAAEREQFFGNKGRES